MLQDSINDLMYLLFVIFFAKPRLRDNIYRTERKVNKINSYPLRHTPGIKSH
jgi:hypothetical protein